MTVASSYEPQLAVLEEATSDADLPEGWTRTKLPQVAYINMGQSPPGASYNEVGKGLPFFQGKADFGDRYPTVRVWCTEPKKLAQPGDVLISVRAPVGPTNVANQTCVIGRGLAALTPLDGIPTEFLLFWLRFQEPELATSGTGSTFTAINKNNLENIDIDIPPLAEQKRIVAKVEALLARVNAARERLAKVPAILKRFRQAVLTAACSGRLTEEWRSNEDENEDLPSGWQWCPVEDLLPKGGIFDGPFGSNLKTSDYTDSGVRVIRMENIAQLKFIESKEAFISEEKYQSLVKHTVGQGDIVFASFIDDEVRVCVLPTLPTKAIAKADCFCLRPNPDVTDSHYLALQLASHDSYDALHESIHGATRPRITTAQLRQLSVRICPLPEQREIVRRVEALFKLADAIEKRVGVATARAEKLTQAILAKAFRGELVPTEAELARQEDRTYEPASALLVRIQAERTVMAQGEVATQRRPTINRRAHTTKPGKPGSKHAGQ